MEDETNQPRAEEEGGGESGMGRWLLTYADMITLLMLFFIVMYAMSTVNQEKFVSMAESLGIGFNIGVSPIELRSNNLGLLGGSGAAAKQGAKTTASLPLPAPSIGNRTAQLYNEALSFFQPELGARRMKIVTEERGFVVQIGADAFFAPGSADLRDEAYEELSKTAGFLARIPNLIRIEGHSDNIPVATKQFPTNWELSSQRAVNVVKTLIDLGIDAKRLAATSFGDTRPLYSNSTPEGRAYNRRIDIVVLSIQE
jgi:chemotaxis protein MotB